MVNKNILCVIPARGGSKGIPYKNIKYLNGKPLILYTIDVARQLFKDEDICISTDDQKIIDVVDNYGFYVPFVRPSNLATDQATTQDVLIHALDHSENKNKYYDIVLLLQPTSPFRLKRHIEETINLYNEDCDMVVSVRQASANPYYNLFEEDELGYLHISKGNGEFTRRQDAPTVWEYNGSIYVINSTSLRKCAISKFTHIIKYPMEIEYSIDVDNQLDWIIAEEYLKRGMVNLQQS
jgi:CMP-N,N'-diacetyllegionaminic acid synthase